jgi:hypothetical protein
MGKDTRQTQTFLTNLAHSIHVDRTGQRPESLHRLVTYGPPPQKDRALLENVQDDPLFQAVLTAAANGIKSEAVRPGLSEPYIALINEFMDKYDPQKWQEGIPDGYQDAQRELKDKLNEHIVSAAKIVTGGIIDTVESSFPQSTHLLSQLREESADDESAVDLFGMPRIIAPDPLKVRAQQAAQ